MAEKKHVCLSKFDPLSFDKGASFFKIVLWYFVSSLFIRPSFIPFMRFKLFLLRLFGARIGKGTLLKPCVIIKSPWYLTVGNDCWIGEKVWIDNIDKVCIGDNVCISQGALLLTGNHNYRSLKFDYKNASIILEDGVWIGAKAVVCPGVKAYSHSILTVGSVATKNLEAYGIYQGNPAVKIRDREIIF